MSHLPSDVRTQFPQAAEALSVVDGLERQLEAVRSTVVSLAESTSTIQILRYRKAVEELLRQEGVSSDVIRKIQDLPQ